MPISCRQHLTASRRRHLSLSPSCRQPPHEVWIYFFLLFGDGLVCLFDWLFLFKYPFDLNGFLNHELQHTSWNSIFVFNFFTITQRFHFCNCMGEVVWNYSRNIDSDDGYLQLSGRGGAPRGEYGAGHVAPACGAGRFRGYLPIVRGGVGAPMIWSRSAPLPSLAKTN